MKNIAEISEDRFEAEVLQAKLPVVVDFYAPWCGPCKMLAPLLEQMAADFPDRIKFAKVNVDNASGLAAAYRVNGVPTLVAFRDGQVVDSLVGLPAPRTLRSWIEGAAASAPDTPAGAPLGTRGGA